MKKKDPQFVEHRNPADNAWCLRMAGPPFIIGKMVKIKDPERAMDFGAKQTQYYIGRVPGFNVFFVHAGFLETPEIFIKDHEIKTAIDEMCHWFLDNKVPGNKQLNKLYKLKN